MKKQEYLDLKKRHEKELADFPIAYAFNEQQLKEALERLGVQTVRECVTIFGHGDIVKRENADAFIEMLERQSKEIKDSITNDHELAEAAFLYEMDNHEYAINWSGDEDVLRCFGFDENDLSKLGLNVAYSNARKQHMKNAMEWGVI
jgi:(p)ppGpp synthase/HD superfamily hydrolase